MDFKNGQELLELCREENAPISTIMKLRETTNGVSSMEEVDKKMEKVLSIMKRAVASSLENPQKLSFPMAVIPSLSTISSTMV